MLSRSKPTETREALLESYTVLSHMTVLCIVVPIALAALDGAHGFVLLATVRTVVPFAGTLAVALWLIVVATCIQQCVAMSRQMRRLRR